VRACLYIECHLGILECFKSLTGLGLINMNKVVTAILMAGVCAWAVTQQALPLPPEGGFGRPQNLNVVAFGTNYQNVSGIKYLSDADKLAEEYAFTLEKYARADNSKANVHGKLNINSGATSSNFKAALKDASKYYNIFFYSGHNASYVSGASNGLTYFGNHSNLTFHDKGIVAVQNIELPSSAYYFIAFTCRFLGFYKWYEDSNGNKIGFTEDVNDIFKYVNMFKNGLHGLLGFNSLSYFWPQVKSGSKVKYHSVSSIADLMNKTWIKNKFGLWTSYTYAVEHYYLERGVPGEPSMIYIGGYIKDRNGTDVAYIPFNETYHNMYRGPVKYHSLAWQRYVIGTPNY